MDYLRLTQRLTERKVRLKVRLLLGFVMLLNGFERLHLGFVRLCWTALWLLRLSRCRFVIMPRRFEMLPREFARPSQGFWGYLVHCSCLKITIQCLKTLTYLRFVHFATIGTFWTFCKSIVFVSENVSSLFNVLGNH